MGFLLFNLFDHGIDQSHRAGFRSAGREEGAGGHAHFGPPLPCRCIECEFAQKRFDRFNRPGSRRVITARDGDQAQKRLPRSLEHFTLTSRGGLGSQGAGRQLIEFVDRERGVDELDRRPRISPPACKRALPTSRLGPSVLLPCPSAGNDGLNSPSSPQQGMLGGGQYPGRELFISRRRSELACSFDHFARLEREHRFANRRMPRAQAKSVDLAGSAIRLASSSGEGDSGQRPRRTTLRTCADV